MKKKAKVKKKTEVVIMSVPIHEREVLNFFIKNIRNAKDSKIISSIYEAYHDPVKKMYAIRLLSNDSGENWETFFHMEENDIVDAFIKGWKIDGVITKYNYLFDPHKATYVFELHIEPKHVEKVAVKRKRKDKLN